MSRNPVPPRMPPRIVPPRAAAPAKTPPPPAVEIPTPTAPADPPKTPETPQTSSPSLYAPGDDVVATAAAYYRNTRYIMVVLLLGMAGWFGYDGFKGWPIENQNMKQFHEKMDAAEKAGDEPLILELKKDKWYGKKAHTEMDILIQKLLAFGLPVAALGMLAWALYRSRGEFRLEGEILTTPGHPPISLGDITEIDKQLWDRKGIAHLSYKSASASGKITLDDFVYERDPIDEIFKRIEAYVTAGAERSA